MSTYLQNGTDYIPNLQPFQPDYNFLGNMLQKRQGAYDSNYKQLNQQYSTLLNSPMLRDDNNKTRDAFFNTINQDIKKISGTDLSLQQNVDAASKVFDSFYQNKPMVYDMVQTKRHQAGISKHEALKACVDPEKCGGQAWEEGLQELYLKADEFKNASPEDAMTMQLGEYTPYYNWQKDAIKTAKDSGLSVTKDFSNGQWIVTQKNGQLVEGGLYQLFKDTYGNDPRVDANYNTKAYVARKNNIRSLVSQYGSEDAAERAYLQETIKAGHKAYGYTSTQIRKANTLVTDRINQLQQKANTQGLTHEESLILRTIPDTKANLDATQKSLDITGNEITQNTPEDLKSLRKSADRAMAFMMQDQDLHGFAKTMSMKDAEYSIKADPYGIQSHSDQLERGRMGIAHQYAKEMLSANLQKDMSLAEYKHLLDTNQLPGQAAEIKGEPLVGAGYGTADLDLEHNLDLIYNKNREQIAGTNQQSVASSANFVWNMFNQAKQNAGKNTSATEYLKNTFGANWSDIKTQEDMLAAYGRKGTPATLFEATLQSLDQSKNPNKDLTWAQTAIVQGSQAINDIKLINQTAVNTLDKNLKANLAIAKSIAATSGGEGQALYANMDLMVTPNGVALIGSPDSEKMFAIAYQNRMGFSTENSQRAHELYEPLKDKFLSVYNNTKNISADQGFGLDGQGMVTGTPMRYAGLDAGKNTNILQKARTFVDLAATKPGEFNFILGDPTKENVSSDSNPVLALFMTQFQNDLRNKTKGNDRPTFTMTEIPIAGNDANTSAVKFEGINPEYLKDYIGTEKNPGILWEVKDQLSQGITMTYNNKTTTSPTVQGLQQEVQNNAYDDVVRSKGFTYSTPYAGDIKISYDGSVGGYLVEGKTNTINSETGQLVSNPQQQVIYTNKVGLDLHKMTNSNLANLNQEMVRKMAQIALQNKNKANGGN